MMTTQKLLNAVSGSGRSPAYFIEEDRVDVHIVFVQPGGSARLVASIDGVSEFAPLKDVPEFTDSIVCPLDLAEGTYLAVEYTGVSSLSTTVKPYRTKQL